MISIVVCTYNRCGTLRRMLESYVAMAGRDAVAHELLVIDNNSPDKTREVVESFSTIETVRYVFEAKQGLSHARSRGVAESSGEIIAFLDDDVLLDVDWLTQLRACFDQTGADVVGGRAELVLEAEAPEWFGPYFRRWLSEVELGNERKPSPDGDGLFGLNLAFRKSKLLACGGFDGTLGRTGDVLLSGEDTETIRAILRDGGKVYYEPGAKVGHLIGAERLEWGYFERLIFAYGRGVARRKPDKTLWVGVKEYCVRQWRRLKLVFGGSLYEQRVALAQVLIAKGLISERWRQCSAKS